MKFDPKTKALYTDTCDFVKILHCPLEKRWEQLGTRPASAHRTCAECDKAVLDTAVLTDAEILAAVRVDPTTCLFVSARQVNITLVRQTLPEPSSVPKGQLSKCLDIITGIGSKHCHSEEQ